MKQVIHWLSFGILWIISPPLSQAQNNLSQNPKIHGDERISGLLKHRVYWADSVGSYDGYRIQIFSSSGALSKTEAIEEKAKFIMAYPKISAYLISQMPYFKVRVGDFKNRLDALKFYHEIQSLYPNSFVVPDEIMIN